MTNAFQKKVASCALVCVSMFAIAAFAVLLTVVVAMFLDKFASVVWPLALATILAIILRPSTDFISSKTRLPLWSATLVVFGVIVAVTIIILAFAIPELLMQISLLVEEIPNGIANAKIFLTTHFPNLKDTIQTNLDALKSEASSSLTLSSAGDSIAKISKAAWKATGGVVHLFTFISAFAVAPIYLFYMLSARFDFFAFLKENIKFCDDETRDTIVFFAKKFSEILTTFFRGQVTIAVIMGFLYGIGFTLLGVKFGFVIGFFAGILNLVPYLGTMTGLGTIIPVAALQSGGGLTLVALALCVFAVVQLLEAYVLTPKIMGDRTGLHPTVIIFSVFFWGVALNGIIGMVLAIPLTAFAVALYRGRKEALAEECAKHTETSKDK